MPDTIRRFDTRLLPAAILSGPGSRRAVGEEAAALGLERVLIVSGPGLRRTTSLADDVAAALGARAVDIYDRIEPNNPSTLHEAAAALARTKKVDGLVSIGGGTVHDFAKALALTVPANRSILDFVLRYEAPGKFQAPAIEVAPLPVMTIPSTFSAAEVLSGGGVTDTSTGEKFIFFHPGVSPVRVFLDGEVAASTPRATLAASGMNAVHHCLEALYSIGRHPVSDAFALAALADLLDVLPSLAPGAPPPTVDAMQRALDGAAISGLTYGNSGLGIGHAICHSLGGRYGLSHSAANAVIVRHSLRFNLEVATVPLAKAVRRLGLSFNDDAAAAQHMVVLVDALADTLGTPKTLREIGLPAGQFDRIAEDALRDPVTPTNPRRVTKRDIVDLLNAAW